MLDAVIIGAGAAGIAAARRLSERGLRYELIEAKPHAGGRSITDNATFGVPVDLGAHWLHSPVHNPLKVIADRLGVRYLENDYATRLVRDGRWLDARETQSYVEHVDARFERIADVGRAGSDCAASEVVAESTVDLTTSYAAERQEGQNQAPWFEAEFVAKQGVPTRSGSTLDYARYVWEGDDLPVVSGFGNLIAELARDVSIRLATPALALDSTRADRIRVTTASGTLEARAVIVTVSTGVLAQDLRFLPGLPDWKRDAIAQLPMGSCNKVALAFERPVFGDLRDCLVRPLRGAEEPIEIVVRPEGHDVAVCLVSGAFGRALARAGSDAMSDYALERLCELFGTSLRRTRRPGRIAVNWDDDPFVRGYVAAALPGHADARAALARDIDSRIYFAGEATHPTFMGDVHGAWLSGIAAADALARH